MNRANRGLQYSKAQTVPAVWSKRNWANQHTLIQQSFFSAVKDIIIDKRLGTVGSPLLQGHSRRPRLK